MTTNSFYIQVWMRLLGKNAKLTKIVRCLTYIAMDSASKKKDVWWHVNLRGKVSNKCGNQIYQLIAQHSKKSLFEIEGKEEKETDGTQENDDSCCSCNGTVVPKGQKYTPDGCNFGDCGGAITWMSCKDEHCKSCKNKEDKDEEEDEDEGKENKEDIQEKEDKKEKEDKQANEDKKEKEDKKETQTKEGKEEKKGKGEKKGKV